MVGLPSATRAQPQPTPQALFRQGETEYAAGRYEVAIALWERAYAMDPRPGLQYNLAQAYGRTGMLAQERRALELFLSRLTETEPGAMQGSEASSARARIAAIDERLARTAIVLRGVPRHAALFVDGTPATLEGDRVRVAAGSHTVRVELAGFEAFSTTVAVAPAMTAEVDVELRVAASAPDDDAPARDVDAEAGTPEAPRGPSRVPEALLISGGTLVVGGSLVGGFAIRASRGEFRGSADADRGHALGIAADVTLGVGAALAVTGLVLLVTRDDGGSETDAPVVALGVGRTQAGTTLPSLEVTW